MLTKIYSDVFAVNGTNSVVYAFLDGSANQNITELSTLSALSFGTSAQVNPVFSLGVPAVTGYTYGANLVSGIMQFAATDQAPIYEISQMVSNNISPMYNKVTNYEWQAQNANDGTFDVNPEMLPPFGLLIVSEPELPRTASASAPLIPYYVIAGVKFTDVTNQLDASSAIGLWQLDFVASKLTRHTMATASTPYTAQTLLDQAQSPYFVPNNSQPLSQAIARWGGF